MEDVSFARYHTADYLKAEADIAAYLEAVMVGSEDDPACITRSMEVVAHAHKTICVAS